MTHARKLDDANATEKTGIRRWDVILGGDASPVLHANFDDFKVVHCVALARHWPPAGRHDSTQDTNLKTYRGHERIARRFLACHSARRLRHNDGLY